MEYLKKHYVVLGTVLFDLFLLWVILRFNLGGWAKAIRFFSQRLTVWGAVLICIAFLSLYKSDFRTDVPLFLSAFLLAYWLEWWGTTRGVWTYLSKATPPIGVIFFWGICLVAVYHLHLVFRRKAEKKEGQRLTWRKMLALCVVPGIALVFAWKGFLQLDWAKHFDLHSVAAILLGGFLILNRFDPMETLWIFLVAAGLGGLLESLATAGGSYRYVTGEGMPLFVPLAWGMICVAMVKLGYLVQEALRRGISLVKAKGPFSP